MKPLKKLQMIFCAGVIGLFFLSGPCVSAQVSPDAVLTYTTADADLQTAKATVAAYERGDWEKLRSNLSEDAVIYGLGNFDSLNVDETISYWTKGREKAFPTLDEAGTWLAVSIPEGPGKGNWVYHWGVNTLTYDNGETITFPYHVAIKIEDNKVAETHFYYDNMKIIRHLGYALSPPLQDTASTPGFPEVELKK